MNIWIECANCGRRNGLTPKRCLTLRCKYCGAPALGNGPAQAMMIVWLMVLAGLYCLMTMAPK